MTWSILELVLFLGVLLNELVFLQLARTLTACSLVHIYPGDAGRMDIFGRSVGSDADTSSRYSFVTGRFDLPVDIPMFATLITPSSPAMMSLTTASLLFTRGISLCINPTTPGFTVCSFFPVLQ